MAETTSTGPRPAPEPDKIVAFLKQIAEAELELDAEQVQRLDMDTAIVEGLQLDSLTQVVLITAIEEAYGFLFEPEDQERLQTIGDLVAMIQERRTQ